MPFVKTRGGTCKTNDSDAQVSTWVRRVWVSMKKVRWNLPGQWGLSSSLARASVVWATSIEFSRVDMLLVMQARFDVLGGGGLCIWQFCLFPTVGECIEDKCSVYLLLQASAAHAQYSCTCFTRGVDMYWRCRTWMSGPVLWCEILGHYFSSHQLPKSPPPL